MSMDISDWIAFGSLLIALCSALGSFLSNRKKWREQSEINKRILQEYSDKEDDRKKALVCASAFEAGRSWRIHIVNNGEGIARNIRFVSEDIENDGAIYIHPETPRYPILNPDDSWNIVLHLANGHNPAPIVKLIWDDEFGKDREREQALDLTF